MSDPPPVRGQKHKRKVVTLEKKIQVIRDMEKGVSRQAAADKLEMTKSTLTEIWKNWQKIEECVSFFQCRNDSSLIQCSIILLLYLAYTHLDDPSMDTAIWLGRLAVFLSRPGPKLRSGFACVIKQHLLGAAWRLHVRAKMAHATVTAEITKLDLTFNAVVFFTAEYSLNHRV